MKTVISPPRISLQERERLLLAPAATSSLNAQRQIPEEESTVRTAFQRDRDRIIHTKSFRRLKHKTQVFIAPTGDHYRTRLTHTIEVSQVARTIGRALGLNEDLIEAIAMGHDLGHTPFGHAGETALSNFLPGFRHNEQSLRVVDTLEKDGRGLNLTDSVRDGILRHSKPHRGLSDPYSERAVTLEGEVIRLADAIAYINHDLDDAIRAGIVSAVDLPAAVTSVLGYRHSERIDRLVVDVVESSDTSSIPGHITMSPDALAAANALRGFLFDRVYMPLNDTDNMRRAQRVVEMLCEYYVTHFDELPPEYRQREVVDGDVRVVADYVASMTDRFAVEQFERIWVPQHWSTGYAP